MPDLYQRSTKPLMVGFTDFPNHVKPLSARVSRFLLTFLPIPLQMVKRSSKSKYHWHIGVKVAKNI